MSLHHRLAGCGFGLAALFALAPLASAATHLDTTAFTFDAAASGPADKLIADANGIATISLSGAGEVLKYLAPSPQYGNYYEGLYQGVFQLKVRPGYRMTGYTLSGTFAGEIYVGQAPTGPNITKIGSGLAATFGGLALRADLPPSSGASGEPAVHKVAGLNGVSAFTLGSGALDHTGAMNLYVEGFYGGESAPAEWMDADRGFGDSDYSIARIELSGPLLLTVHTQAVPVPEPHTYALTLAGLALIGGAARRRPARAIGLAGSTSEQS